MISRSAAAGIVLPTSLTQLGLNPDWQLATIFVVSLEKYLTKEDQFENVAGVSCIYPLTWQLFE